MSRPLERVSARLIAILIIAVLLILSGAQQLAAAPQNQTPSATEQKSGQDASKPQSENESKPGPRITPEQAEQLFRDVDTILDFASKDTNLPIKHEVKRRLATREEVVSYLQKNMAEDK